MTPNFLVLAASAVIPFLVAFGWYHPKLFGGDNWTRISGMTSEQAGKPVTPLKLLLSIVLNFFVAFGIYSLAVHASGVFGLVSADVELMKTGTAAAFLAEYGHKHLSFGHGMVHGFGAVLMFILPALGYVVIFERKSTKYLLVNLGFWLISMMLMGGVICQWGAVAA